MSMTAEFWQDAGHSVASLNPHCVPDKAVSLLRSRRDFPLAKRPSNVYQYPLAFSSQCESSPRGGFLPPTPRGRQIRLEGAERARRVLVP